MYNASLHTATNKPIGLTGKPTDARTYYYDTATFSYRPYTNTAEALAYLIGQDRVGHYSIIIGTDEYWFKNGIADVNLVLKGYVPPTPPQVTQSIAAGQPAPYVLTSPQLAIVNSMGRYGNFQALIGGVVFPDIEATYSGSPGSFTSISVNLHNDGSGVNIDTTFIQFT